MATIWEDLAKLAAQKQAEADCQTGRSGSGSDRPQSESGETCPTPSTDGQRRICEIANRTEVGHLTGYDCPDCKNRGFYFRVDEHGRRYTEECRCMGIRRNLWRIGASGLYDLVNRYTFDNWKTPEPWQAEILKAAKRYAEEPDGWFAVCGRSGSGKTHICTAICGELMLKRGMDVRYMLWRDLGTKIKASMTDAEAYRDLVEPLKNARVLYIDDLFKVGKGQAPTTADVNLAFEILNHRYNTKGLYTIISSEMSLEKILETDEAVGSRIYERTKRNGFIFDLGDKRNWRIEGET